MTHIEGYRCGRMTISEIITIITCFHMSYYRDFKNYYLGFITRFYKDAYPDLFSSDSQQLIS